MGADLHIHSTFSDGSLTPEQIVAEALANELTAIAIADHDTVSGVPVAQAAALGTGLEVLPAVEISAVSDSTEVHILGYFIDTEDGALLSQLGVIRAARLRRARTIADRLAELGAAIDFEQLLAEAGPDSIGRPHIAGRLVREGKVTSMREAFARYLGRGRPAYVESYRLTPREGIALVADAGGLAVLAHPGLHGAEQLIGQLVKCGLGGLEAYHVHHSPAQLHYFLRVARQRGLLVTGGTDSHGPGGPVPVAIGAVPVPDECATQLLDWARAQQVAGPE